MSVSYQIIESVCISNAKIFHNKSANMLGSNKINEAEKLAKIAIACWPEMDKTYFLLSLISSLKNDKNKSLSFLNRSVLFSSSYIQKAQSIGMGNIVMKIADKHFKVIDDYADENYIDYDKEKAPNLIVNKPIYWPTLELEKNNDKNISEIIREHVLTKIPNDIKIINKSSSVMSVGSCFAVNIGISLKNSGIMSYITNIPEEINTTYANKYFFDWIESGSDSKYYGCFERLYGDFARQEIRSVIKEVDVFFITLGVAPCLFNKKNGEFVVRVKRENESIASHDNVGSDSLVMRMTSVEENVENIEHIIHTIKRFNKNANIVISVSPVPLGGIKGFDSIFEADCISKSTMRLAAYEISKIFPEVIYWPSFEIVRWLGAHVDMKLFGADDGNSRHVNVNLINIIMKLFLETYGDLSV